jgi:hypothetical protein
MMPTSSTLVTHTPLKRSQLMFGLSADWRADEGGALFAAFCLLDKAMLLC